MILAIDPGHFRSAWVEYDPELQLPTSHGIVPNEELLELIVRTAEHRYADAVVVEKIQGMGMAVGREVFETVYWSGRFHEAAGELPVIRVTRRDVKQWLCGSDRAKDPNIRQALLDRWPAGKGTKRQPGPLYGISADVWSALAVAVTYAERTELGLGFGL
jgi:hypothetical protein